VWGPWGGWGVEGSRGPGEGRPSAASAAGVILGADVTPMWMGESLADRWGRGAVGSPEGEGVGRLAQNNTRRRSRGFALRARCGGAVHRIPEDVDITNKYERAHIAVRVQAKGGQPTPGGRGGAPGVREGGAVQQRPHDGGGPGAGRPLGGGAHGKQSHQNHLRVEGVLGRGCGQRSGVTAEVG